MFFKHRIKPAALSGRLLILVVLLSSPTHGFFRHLCYNPLGFARIDPIMSPGEPSQHVHHLHGGHNLGLDSGNADYLLKSNCTSCSITVDKSNYWTPAMYFQHENGTFSLLRTSAAITVYYKLEKRANFEDQNYTVFPKGFRMIAGTNAKRSWVGPWPVPQESLWGPNDTAQPALAEKALGFNCLNYNSGHNEASMAFPYIRDKGFTDAHCADGIRAELLFPSCWDGVNLDSADHKSHVAYPDLIQDGACPSTHPVYLPILFFETIWVTQEFIGVPGRYILANGDPTGYGYHGDFIAAWQDGVLQQIMDDPTCTDHSLTHRTTSGIQEECLAIKDHIQSQYEAAKCKLVTPEPLIHEQVDGLLPALPNNVKINGVRHDPGEQVPSSVASDVASSSMMSSSAAPVPVCPASAPEASSTSIVQSVATTTVQASVTAVATNNPDLMALDITTITSGNVRYEVAVVHTLVTVTLTLSSEPIVMPRHDRELAHGHGHVHI